MNGRSRIDGDLYADSRGHDVIGRWLNPPALAVRRRAPGRFSDCVRSKAQLYIAANGHDIAVQFEAGTARVTFVAGEAIALRLAVKP